MKREEEEEVEESDLEGCAGGSETVAATLHLNPWVHLVVLCVAEGGEELSLTQLFLLRWVCLFSLANGEGGGLSGKKFDVTLLRASSMSGKFLIRSKQSDVTCVLYVQGFSRLWWTTSAR